MKHTKTTQTPRRTTVAAAAIQWAACFVGFCAGGCTAPPQEVRPPTASAQARSQALPATSAEHAPLQIAITVDDLPLHSDPLPGQSQLDIHTTLLEAFNRHEVPQVYGFINAAKVERDPALEEVLRAWTAAGHPLGNHTFSHPSLRERSLPEYFDDIAKNEPLLDALALDGERVPTFRYPFLLEGMTEADTHEIREHLHARGYRIAPATIDFYDWAFNAPYARCMDQGDDAAVTALRKTFLSHALEMVAWADAAALDLYGRRVPQVLLMHSGVFAAEMVEPMLDALEDRGVEWISLDAALKDPIYSELPAHAGRNQGTLLEQVIDAGGQPHPPWITHPDALLGALCPPAPRKE